MPESETQRTDHQGQLGKSLKKSAQTMARLLPIIISALLLLSLFNNLVPRSFYVALFKRSLLLDSIMGSLVGSISAGHPMTSYILGGEFLRNGVGISAVTAFLVAWVTVGIVQLPVEIMILGRRFAIARNLSAFVFAVTVGIVTMLILRVI
ncbi:MAG: hypothetical protein PVI51_04415 [candidate division WOR-3 bacterium]